MRNARIYILHCTVQPIWYHPRYLCRIDHWCKDICFNSINAYIKKPSSIISRELYLEPFSDYVWICIFVVSISVWIFTEITLRWVPKVEENFKSDSLLWSFSALVSQQGCQCIKTYKIRFCVKSLHTNFK